MAALLLPALALARTATEDADALAETGKKAAEAGNAAKAVAAFREAFALVPDSKYAWNLARLYEVTQEYGEAHGWYVLARKTAPNLEKRAKVTEALGALEAKLLKAGFGRVEVVPQPAEVTVTVGAFEVAGEEGRYVRWCKPGAHSLKAEKAGYQTATDLADVTAGGEKRWAPQLQREVSAAVTMVPKAAQGGAGGWREPTKWASAALGLAAAGLGSAWMTGGAAEKASANKLPITSSADKDAYKAAAAAANSKWQRGAISAGVGAVALGTAIWLFVSDGAAPTATVRFVPTLQDGGGGWAMVGEF